MIDNTLINKINKEIELYQSNNLFFSSEKQQTSIWHKQFANNALIQNDGTVNSAVLKDFRRSLKFVIDDPTLPGGNSVVDEQIRRIYVRKFIQLTQALGNNKALRWVRKYPTPMIGSPDIANIQVGDESFPVTHRWIKHLSSLEMFDRYLTHQLPEGFTSIDIGASYGIFQYLIFNERPDSHQVLVDFSEQLITARYFLQTCFPDARIAGVEELVGQVEINREFIGRYDFILLPTKWYEKLSGDAIDLVTSFACLGELKRDVFEYYTEHPAYLGAKFFYLANPIAPTPGTTVNGETDISLLDYKCIKRENQVFFNNAPLHILKYGPNLNNLQPFFEYIGTGDSGVNS
jgi:putative sugar O-methyltransferase